MIIIFTPPSPVIGFIQKKENDSILQMVKIHFFFFYFLAYEVDQNALAQKHFTFKIYVIMFQNKFTEPMFQKG